MNINMCKQILLSLLTEYEFIMIVMYIYERPFYWFIFTFAFSEEEWDATFDQDPMGFDEYDQNDETWDSREVDSSDDDESEDVSYLDVTGNLVKYVHFTSMMIHIST